MFSLYFVKDGPFTTREAHIFSRLMKYRLEADYSASYSFTAEDYGEFREDAQRLQETILSHLRENNWI